MFPALEYLIIEKSCSLYAQKKYYSCKLGFISNTAEEKYLNEHKQVMAHAIARGIRLYAVNANEGLENVSAEIRAGR